MKTKTPCVVSSLNKSSLLIAHSTIDVWSVTPVKVCVCDQIAVKCHSANLNSLKFRKLKFYGIYASPIAVEGYYCTEHHNIIFIYLHRVWVQVYQIL